MTTLINKSTYCKCSKRIKEGWLSMTPEDRGKRHQVDVAGAEGMSAGGRVG